MSTRALSVTDLTCSGFASSCGEFICKAEEMYASFNVHAGFKIIFKIKK